MLKKRIVFLMILALTLMISFAAADEDLQVQIELEYMYDNAKSMLPLINEFRTGDGAWYWNSDDTEQVQVTDLEELTYDYGLEKAAMQRAAEIALFYSHTRPNNTSCFTMLPGYMYGENIAAGYRSKESVFEAWKEENEYYSGQGHRRNMLSSYTKYIGVGCVYCNGRYFWVQEFGRYPTEASQKKLEGPAVISCDLALMQAGDGNNSGLTELAGDPESLEIAQGKNADLPELTAWCGWHGRTGVVLLGDMWTTTDTSVIEVRDGKVYTIAPGKAVLKAVPDETVTVQVVSVCSVHKWNKGTVTQEVTCTADGMKIYECLVCGKTKEEIIESPGHDLIGHKKVDATCIEAGTEAWWECSVCGQLFADAKGEEEIEEPTVIPMKAHTLKKHERVEPTCTEEGSEVYWSCSACGYLFSDEKAEHVMKKVKVIAATGHLWSKPEYTWSVEERKARAVRVCEHDSEHVEKEEVSISCEMKYPTEKTQGTSTYKAVFSNEAFEEQQMIVKIPALQNLKVLRLPEGVKSIREEAFRNGTFEAVIIPDGCEEIGKDAFRDCPNLVYVRVPGSVKTLPADVFDGSDERLMVERAAE